MRAIVAGLLLQAGFLELEPDESIGEKAAENFYMLDNKAFVNYLKAVSKQKPSVFPIELLYGKSIHGKPFWEKEILIEKLSKSEFENKKMWNFNLSHSGDYVVLIISDVEVGIDIQEPRSEIRFPGGYHAFSRMEAYVKCTGEGYSNGYRTYDECNGCVPGYEIRSVKMFESYALNVCFAMEKKGKMEHL